MKLRIKKSVKLPHLGKYGFTPYGDYGYSSAKMSNGELTEMYIDTNRVISMESDLTGGPTTDLVWLYDMIMDGIVEKVED